MEYRTERDSMGEIKVEAGKLWGAQTQRSLENFKISSEKMPVPLIHSLALIKKAAARVNHGFFPERMTEEKLGAIDEVCDEIIKGALDSEFPLSVWQTGSGTQTNMNVNEVISNRANFTRGKKLLHPNDDVNMSQSSNDVFPSAIQASVLVMIKEKLFPALDALIDSFEGLMTENEGIIKTARTHLQDATPILFSQEIGGWKSAIVSDRDMIEDSLKYLSRLALGGTAVGTGLNSPRGFGARMASELSALTGYAFTEAPDKFEALSSKNAVSFCHGALRTLAADLMKIANDIRLLSSGPRCGLGEIRIPENEPGSSIMPGKVNPTQCEALIMAAMRVIGNDASVGFAASQGNFQLNVCMPLIAYGTLQSVSLLSDAVSSFDKNCVRGITANAGKMNENLSRSLMLVTSLSPYIGYDKAARIAKTAYKDGVTLREACLSLGYMSGEEFDAAIKPGDMVHPKEVN